MKDAITAMSGAEADFKKALLTEIDATRDQIGRAILARLVRDRINAVAAEYEKNGELIKLSDEIDSASSQARQFILKIHELPVPADTKPDAFDGMLDGQITKIKASIDVVAALPQLSPQEKEAVLRRKTAMDLWAQKTYPGRNDLITLLQLSRIRAYVDKSLLKQLDAHVAALKTVHNTIDAWIQTDVNVDGKQVADLFIDAKNAVAPPAATPAPSGGAQ
jgi:hypothetical protein